MIIRFTKYFIAFSLVFLLSFAKAFGQTNKDTTFYTVEATLVKAEPLPPDCGWASFAIAQEFKVIESNMPFYPRKGTIIVIEQCPEFLGYNFFKTGTIYTIKIYQNKEDNSAVNLEKFKKKNSFIKVSTLKKVQNINTQNKSSFAFLFNMVQNAEVCDATDVQ